jgi:hypothetical protein
MLDFLLKNRELAAAIASVIVAVLGVFTALLKRNTSHTIRHEIATDFPSSQGGRRTARRGGSVSPDLASGVSIAGDYLCVGNDSFHRSQITGVALRMGLGGGFAMLMVLPVGLLALGAWGSGDRGTGAIMIVVALLCLARASMKSVYLSTPRGSRRIARNLFPGRANTIRQEILWWMSH